MSAKLMSITGLLLIGAALVLAQQPDGPGRGGPPPLGFGPPGFDRMLFGGSNRFSASGVMLLAIPPVRAELKLTEAQDQAVDKVVGKMQGEFRDAIENLNPRELFSLDDEDRQKRLGEFRTLMIELAADSDKNLKESLSAEQWQRLQELSLQRQGAAAILRQEVTDKLILTEAQLATLRKLESDQNARLGGLMGGPGGPPDFGRQENQIRELNEKMLAELTDGQKSKWVELQGKSFDFPAPPRPGFGGPGMMQPERKLLAQFDQDGDKLLNSKERQAAREFMKKNGGGDRPGLGRPFGGPPGPGGPGGPGGPFGRGRREPARKGLPVSPAEVKNYPDAKLYDPTILRTIFLNFENDDWETELSDFHNSDVEVPATMIVDGVTYPKVGIRFRGMSSYGMVPAGYKRSLNIAMDLADEDQRLYGYKTLNLLNCHEDASCMSTVLYSHIARKHIPAPRANFVSVVINGECWGVYANVQQFNREFLSENFPSTRGQRWKVRGSPGGGGGLDYLGDKVDDYRKRYEIKTKDSDKAWQGLIKLCRTLSETPAELLPQAIESQLDVEQLLWFLALDVTLINNDGYWVRASDYSIYQDENGKFHIVPHDMNEAFHPAMMGFGPGGGRGPDGPGGRGRRPDAENASGGPERGRGEGPPGGGTRGGPGGPPGGGPRGGGVQLDPLIGLNDDRKPLRSKILAVPKYRQVYLEHVREIADNDLNWKNLGPTVAGFRALIEQDLKSDTRKLESFEAFERATANDPQATDSRGREMPLRLFADQRREWLLKSATLREVTQ